MILNLENILSAVNREITEETIAFVGLGSIGSTTLNLMLKVLQHPKKIILCDLFSKQKHLETIKDEIYSKFNFIHDIHIASSNDFGLPNDIYEAKLIIGATNLSGILDVTKLKPGTIIVDDTAPHIFGYAEIMKRFQSSRDVFAIQGGKLLLPESIKFTHNPAIKSLFSKERNEKIKNINKYEIMGCTLGSILPLVSDLTPPTIGKIDTCIVESYFNFLKQKNIKASHPQFFYFTFHNIYYGTYIPYQEKPLPL